MLTTARWLFTVEDLKELDDPSFGDVSLAHFAGRCLLDVLEYLRTDLGQRGRFHALLIAHALRLTIQCLSQIDATGEHLSMFSRHIERNYRRLRDSRNDEAPFYGDDFWDWAYILDAFVAVKDNVPILRQEVGEALTIEAAEFTRAVEARIETGLSFDRPGEWFGPAVPAAVYRVMDRLFAPDKQAQLPQALRAQALQPIGPDGRYMGKIVAPSYHHWHYGQVVAAFPNDAQNLEAQISDLAPLDHLEGADRAYALSRVIQGLSKVGRACELTPALDKLFDLESRSRAFGTGLVADNVKASVNSLEAIWPLAPPEQKTTTLARMVDAIVTLQKRQNMVGVLVAIDREEDAVLEAFRDAGAETEPGQQQGVTLVKHPTFCAVVAKGKALLDSGDAVRGLINGHHVKWLILAGIAGSLGTTRCWKLLWRFVGPKKGDVVLAASLAPYGVRSKVRDQTCSVGVPFHGCVWEEIPVDPGLYTIAYREAMVSRNIAGRFHTGLILTHPGVLDNRKAKAKILSRWPAGKAVEEEGYVACLVAQLEGVPALVIRGISDLAEGDKRKQDDAAEKAEQEEAARIAAELAVKTILALSKEW